LSRAWGPTARPLRLTPLLDQAIVRRTADGIQVRVLPIAAGVAYSDDAVCVLSVRIRRIREDAAGTISNWTTAIVRAFRPVNVSYDSVA